MWVSRIVLKKLETAYVWCILVYLSSRVRVPGTWVLLPTDLPTYVPACVGTWLARCLLSPTRTRHQAKLSLSLERELSRAGCMQSGKKFRDQIDVHEVQTGPGHPPGVSGLRLEA